MSSSAVAVRPTNNLAYSFQEVLTAVLRVRSQAQALGDAEGFRTQMRKLLQTAMGDARSLGYNNQYIQMAVLVAVGFLDETVLNQSTAAVAEWSRRPLQEELFGGHLAGETVFTNIASLLQQQDAAEIADVLELHCLCLELGYKGRYAFGGTGELRQIVQRCREKILRVRGRDSLFTAPVPPPPPERRTTDRIARGLLISTVALAVLTVAAFAGYEFSLSAGASRLQSNSVALR